MKINEIGDNTAGLEVRIPLSKIPELSDEIYKTSDGKISLTGIGLAELFLSKIKLNKETVAYVGNFDKPDEKYLLSINSIKDSLEAKGIDVKYISEGFFSKAIEHGFTYLDYFAVFFNPFSEN